MPAKRSHSYLKEIAIVGAGGLGREVLLLLHQINQAMPTWHVLGFYDDNINSPAIINQYPYLGTVADLNNITKPLHVVFAIGDPQAKARLAAQLTSDKVKYPILLHPDVAQAAYQFNKIGAGSIISTQSVLTTNITLGKHVFLNLGCTVGHDAVIKDFCSLMPRVNIAGNAVLQPQVYVGTAASVLPGIEIGKKTTVGAGAIVTQNLPSNCTAAGVPARIIKKHER